MKIFPVSQISSIDQYTIEHEPIDSIDLMERASQGFYDCFIDLYPHGDVSILVGPGNNGGDALAVARMLYLSGRNVIAYVMSNEDKLSRDAQINLVRLRESGCSIIMPNSTKDFMSVEEKCVIIDGLFGSGLNRPIEGFYKEVIQYVNSIDVPVVSIDLPSGLFGEDNRANDLSAIVMADHTISFQFPKLAFLLAENEHFVGAWQVVDIGLHPAIIHETKSDYCFSERLLLKRLLKSRSTFTHKGDCGHALLLAGSVGKMGAAILSSKACLKSGVGLLTTHVPRMGYNVIQITTPESMVSIDRSEILISEFPDLHNFSAIGIGPGIGTKPNTQSALRDLLESLNGKPIVLDADALNILALDESLWSLLPNNAVLTPHPGEFDRLAGSSLSSYERLRKAKRLAVDLGVTIVLKGAFTAVIDNNGHCYFNPTGNSGMATAGSGDVLTGIILAFLTQGYSAIEAARLAVYLHGSSADIALQESSEEAIVASEIVENLGAAFQQIRR
ncbi:NAD(P)H-hydrate dehydratase [Carboxylicivirga sp. M1479]|uniref:NAD(P)H-hydrate dehydratase n=1 Tax=Carboxylicivirga sp. M1479 TaxID=2594476 RepID=UPI001178A1B6|nr:NAD(P)H-hydrate dehydratase [Carboxylicivirga sp. M1479]TRX71979.1 NAD(P)H-hydrate dehydratase [Carboxylicivirga sp. M1479]